MGTIAVKHASDPEASFTFRNTPCLPDENGVILCPAAAVPGILSHGFVPIVQEE